MVLRNTQNVPVFEIQSLAKLEYPNALVIGLFTFLPRWPGMHQKPHVVYAWTDFKGFMLRDLKSLLDCLKHKCTSTKPMMAPYVLNMPVCVPCWRAEDCCEIVLKAQAKSESEVNIKLF